LALEKRQEGPVLNAEDHKTLCDMVANDGRIRVISTAGKKNAKQLIELGYARIVPIDVMSLAIEITERGRVAKVLADFGIWSPDFCAIEPQPSEIDDQWVIKVSTVSRSPVLIDVTNAIELVTRLTEVGGIHIARQFQTEIERTRRYMTGLLCAEIR
jgi:hypothetical protein